MYPLGTRFNSQQGVTHFLQVLTHIVATSVCLLLFANLQLQYQKFVELRVRFCFKE